MDDPEVVRDDELEEIPPTWWDRNERRVYGALAILLVVALIVGGIMLLRHSRAAPAQQAVKMSDQMVAEATANATIAADGQLAALCPLGWNEACATALAAEEPPIPNPVCTKTTAMPVSASNAAAASTAQFRMDAACSAAALRIRMGEIAADHNQVTRPEQVMLGNEYYQEEIFASGDSSRMNLLITDRRLSREVILRHWHDSNVSWTILSHPALTPADTAQVYGVIQANGWVDAMPFLLINPNLDSGIRGMWIARPESDPGRREATILLGLHQPGVATGLVSYLVDQSVEDGNAGNFSLWTILLKAASNGDLPGPRCRLVTDKDEERKDYPLCVKNVQWDFIQQMKEVQEANISFPAPAAGWDAVRKTCQWETMAGRHSGGALGAASLVVPKMSDVVPPGIGQ